MSHPSFGGAWIGTAMLKQPFSPTFSVNEVSTIEFSKKTPMYICIVVVLMSFINELLPLGNTSVVFDVYDALATVLAEIIAFNITCHSKRKDFNRLPLILGRLKNQCRTEQGIKTH